MRSKQIKVPRGLIKKFYQHPENFSGFYIVLLKNGMETDVFFKEDGFVTITNDPNLIKYLKKFREEDLNQYYYNGPFSVCETKDFSSFNERVKSEIVIKTKFNNNNLPKHLVINFYLITFGIVTIGDNTIKIEIVDNNLINDVDIELGISLMINLLNSLKD